MEANLTENSPQLSGQLESRLTENAENLGRISENTGSLGENLVGLRGEMNTLNGGLKNVKESVNMIKIQVENQLRNIQSEWGERMDSRLRNIRSELDEQVQEISGALTSQVTVVSQQVEQMKEQVNSAQGIARSNGDQMQNRLREIEGELRKLQNQSEASTVNLCTERSPGQEMNVNEPGRSRLLNQETRTSSIVQTVEQGPDHESASTGHVSLPQSQLENPQVAPHANSLSTVTPGSAFPRHGPILGNEVTLPHFSNGKNENPVQFLSALEDYFMLKATPDYQKVIIVKSALGGTVLAWYQIFIMPGTTYEAFKDAFLNFFWERRNRGRLNRN